MFGYYSKKSIDDKLMVIEERSKTLEAKIETLEKEVIEVRVTAEFQKVFNEHFAKAGENLCTAMNLINERS